MHDVLMITYKRPEFTKMALGRLLESCDSSMRVWVWHNGSHQDTIDVVKGFESHPRFHKLRLSAENLKLREPTNWFWKHAEGEYLSKVDDDCLVPDGWGEKLRKAHDAEPRLGLAATWLFHEEDFLPAAAARKMRTFANGIQIMTHGFVQGSGYVMKRAVYRQLGPIRKQESFTKYGIRAAYRGWINGWLFPFIHQDHMDDPRSPNYPHKTEEDFQKTLSLSKKQFGIQSIEEALAFSRTLARNAQEEIIDPRSHFGFTGLVHKVKRRVRKVLGGKGI